MTTVPVEHGCEVLAWDSAFFGVRVARVGGLTLTPERADAVDAWCRAQDIDCACFLAPSDDPGTVRTAEDHGFRLVDVRMDLVAAASALGTGAPDALPAGARVATPADVEALRAIAGQGVRDTRFWFDPRFPRDRCAALYETWVTKACEGRSDRVFVAGAEGRPHGFVACTLRPGPPAIGRIDLVGIDEAARGRGLGRLLVGTAVAWCAARGAREVFVATQARNVAAQRLYQACGFRTHSVQLWYHRWAADMARPGVDG